MPLATRQFIALPNGVSDGQALFYSDATGAFVPVSAATARGFLGTAASGANADITSLGACTSVTSPGALTLNSTGTTNYINLGATLAVDNNFTGQIKLWHGAVLGWTGGGSTEALVTGLSQPAPNTFALGNGTPGDASGTVLVNNISTSVVRLRYLNTSDNSYSVFRFVDGSPDAFLYGNLTANGTIHADGMTLGGNYDYLFSSGSGGYCGIRCYSGFGVQNSAQTTVFRVDANGSVSSTAPGTPTSEYTLSGLPSAAAWTGKSTSVSNPASDKSYAVRSDGTNWRYVADQSIAA